MADEKALIRGEIQLQAEKPEDLAYALRVIAQCVMSSCRLDEPEGVEKYEDLCESIITATFKVLPVYRAGDLEKFVGCAPDFTNGLSTAEHIAKVRGESSDTELVAAALAWREAEASYETSQDKRADGSPFIRLLNSLTTLRLACDRYVEAQGR